MLGAKYFKRILTYTCVCARTRTHVCARTHTHTEFCSIGHSQSLGARLCCDNSLNSDWLNTTKVDLSLMLLVQYRSAKGLVHCSHSGLRLMEAPSWGCLPYDLSKKKGTW